MTHLRKLVLGAVTVASIFIGASDIFATDLHNTTYYIQPRYSGGDGRYIGQLQSTDAKNNADVVMETSGVSYVSPFVSYYGYLANSTLSTSFANLTIDNSVGKFYSSDNGKYYCMYYLASGGSPTLYGALT